MTSSDDPYRPPPPAGSVPTGQPPHDVGQPGAQGPPPHEAGPYTGSQPYSAPPSGSVPSGSQYGPSSGSPYGGGGPRRNGMGVTALVLGILSILLCWLFGLPGIILGIAAIVLGVMGRQRAQRGEADNRGVATAGLITGAVGLVLSLLFGVLFIAGIGFVVSHKSEFNNLADCVRNAGNDQAKIRQCQDEFEGAVNR